MAEQCVFDIGVHLAQLHGVLSEHEKLAAHRLKGTLRD